MIAVRPSSPEDRPRIQEVRKRAWEKAYRDLIPAHIIAEATAPNRTRAGLIVPEAILHSRQEFVAEDADQIIGFVAGGLPRETIVPADCELWAIYVDPEAHGKGAGRLLLETFKNAMKENSRRKMVLWVLKTNLPSRQFYERLGGRLEAREKMFKWNGEEVVPEVAYGWDL